jgi:hypothetical protein
MLEGEIMRSHLPSFFNSGSACVALIGVLATFAGAQTPLLKWDRDTIVEKEYQTSFCHNNPDKTAICSDAFSITQSGFQRVSIDSIYVKVTTSGIQSSQAMVRYGQNFLYFVYHATGRYPWKVAIVNETP